MTSICPANKKPIAQVQQGTVQDLEECIVESRKAWQVSKGFPHVEGCETPADIFGDVW